MFESSVLVELANRTKGELHYCGLGRYDCNKYLILSCMETGVF